MAPRRCALRRAFLLLAAALCVGAPSRAAPAPDGGVPDNADCGGAYHANATRQLHLNAKAGFGVIFVAHHGVAKKKESFVQQAIASANSYRDASIRLPRTLITSAGGPPLPGALAGALAGPTALLPRFACAARSVLRATRPRRARDG